MPSPTLFPALQNNQLVDLTAMNGIENAVRTLVGNAVAAIVGSTNANSGDQTFTATISGTTLTVGGSGGQKILINSANGPRIVDSVPTATFTVPTADTTNPRHDILYAVYTQQSVSAGSGSFATVSGTTITGTSTSSINNAEEYLTYTYATGTPASSPTDPSGPTNGVAIARVTVPVNSTTPTVSVLLTSMQAQILSGISGYVDVTSNQSIGGNKTFTGTTTIAGMQFIQTGGRLSGPGIRLDASNNVIISPGANAQILIGYDQPSINAVYFGPSNEWGYVNPNNFLSPQPVCPL